MKNLTLKQSIFILAAVLTVASLFTSCKKDSEPDDPNIAYTSINKVLTTSAAVIKQDSIDVNLDTKNDYMIYSGFSSTGDTAADYLIGTTAAGVYIDSTQKIGSIYVIKPLDKGQVPETVGTARRWDNKGIVGYKLSTLLTGFAGAGDKYVPIVMRNPLTTKFHYGWVRVNLSSDFTTYKVIDCAYNLIPETPIAMGAK